MLRTWSYFNWIAFNIFFILQNYQIYLIYTFRNICRRTSQSVIYRAAIKVRVNSIKNNLVLPLASWIKSYCFSICFKFLKNIYYYFIIDVDIFRGHPYTLQTIFWQQVWIFQCLDLIIIQISYEKLFSA